MYAVIIETEEGRHAIIKTEIEQQMQVVASLCSAHLQKVYPGCKAWVLHNHNDIMKVEMHPRKEEIMGKLREAEFPLPKPDMVIEGEYQRL